MCDTKSVMTVALIAATVYTGGAAASMAYAGTSAGVAAGAGAASAATIGTGLTAMAGAAAGLGQATQAEAQEKILKRNAVTADMQAEDAIKRGGIAEDKHRSQVRQFMGEQRASMAAAGGVLDSGTYAAIADQTSFMGESDALTIRSNAAREAWGYKNQAAGQSLQADFLSNAKRWRAGGSILTTGAQAYGVYRRA